MTTIIHHNGVLYADQCHIRMGKPITSFMATKLFVSKDKQFAYGISGTCFPEEKREAAEAAIRLFLEEVVTTMTSDWVPKTKLDTFDQLDNAIGEVHCVFMTKTKVFSTTAVGCINATGTIATAGSGQFILAGMIAGGMTPREAYARLGDLDTNTCGKVDSVSMKSLKPFVIKGASK